MTANRGLACPCVHSALATTRRQRSRSCASSLLRYTLSASGFSAAQRKVVVTTTLADSQPRCTNLCEKCGLTLRRHDQWLAPATTPRDLGAAAELQPLRKADPDTGQLLLVALDGHTLRREIWVCFDESSLDCGRRNVAGGRLPKKESYPSLPTPAAQDPSLTP